MKAARRKSLGSYYTPPEIAAALVRWAVRRPGDRLPDPSCGDGRFLSLHSNGVGVDCDPAAVAQAKERAPGNAVHEADFFEWARSTDERFDCAAGNPPFIRYRRFAGRTRRLAQALCGSLGAPVSGLASSWAPYLIATGSPLRPRGARPRPRSWTYRRRC